MKEDAPNKEIERRTTLNGCWILDKSRDNWSMNEYLQTMNVDPLAIEAHEKGEKEYETYHTIEFINNNTGVKIVKRSRVNNDVVVELNFGQEYQQYLQPNNRLKSSIATSDHLGHLCIKSSLVTTDNHGTAIVTDIKRLQTIEETVAATSTLSPPPLPILTTTTTPNEGDKTKVQADDTESGKMEMTDTADNNEPLESSSIGTTTTTTVLVQELTIQNVETGQSHTTTRYFLPYHDTPPHLVPIVSPNADNLDDNDMMDE
jgi:hypothetical protein